MVSDLLFGGAPMFALFDVRFRIVSASLFTTLNNGICFARQRRWNEINMEIAIKHHLS